jgi:hypothetical protein
MNVTFAIEGGQDGYYYDVFAGTILTAPLKTAIGHGRDKDSIAWFIRFQIYPKARCFLVLGTPQDTDGDGLTDAYENLVSQYRPEQRLYQSATASPDGWDRFCLGLSPQTGQLTPRRAQRANYRYTPTDWLNGVSGVRSGTITTDNEGNVQSVSQ